MKIKLIDFIKDEDGVTAIEYSLIAALIALVIFAGVAILGTTLGDTYDNISQEVSAAS